MKQQKIEEEDLRNLDLASDYSLVLHAHEGIGIHYFDQLLETTGVSKGLLASLVGVDPRTIDNYRKHQKKFDTLEGEHLLKLARLFLFGEEVFESMEDFRRWLEVESIGLGKTKPVALLDTSTGVDLVHDELMRIEEGYVV
jgi:putative toxin-antitoxin system antitoxin component (TIGR02293 family)